MSSAAQPAEHPSHDYAARFPDLPFSTWPGGQRVSAAGFGAYRAAAGIAAHEDALKQALRSGINLIDTSTNYGNGRSEDLVGAVLADNADIKRDELVLVTKVGYIQGANYKLAQEREADGKPFPEVTRYAEGLWHCIHPDFIEDQLSRSLQRLRLDCVDVLLLHNPEYFLGWAKEQGMKSDAAQTEFYRRIELAFRHLEEEVRRGRILSYGISSNTFPLTSASFDFCALDRVWAIAASLGSQQHFNVIQLPMNLVERGAALNANQEDGSRTVLDFAAKQGIAVLINRPLNAITSQHLLRLAERVPAGDIAPGDINEALAELRSHEQKIEQQIRQRLKLDENLKAQLWEFLSSASTLQRYWQGFGSLEHWANVRQQFLQPRLDHALQALAAIGDPAVDAWAGGFTARYGRVFALLDDHFRNQSAARSSAIKARALSVLGTAYEEQTLSALAINALRASPGVSSVLVGMRQPTYVDDVLEALRRDLPITGHDVWEALADLDRI